MTRTLTWIRSGDRYPDIAVPDDFIAMDGDIEVGLVKLVESGPDRGWFWSLTLVHPGPAFRLPTNGQCATRGEAVSELRECYAAFRLYYGIEDA